MANPFFVLSSIESSRKLVQSVALGALLNICDQ